MTGALGGIFTMKEEEGGGNIKRPTQHLIRTFYIYIYIYIHVYTIQNKRTYTKVSSPSAMREEDDVGRKTQSKGQKSPLSSHHDQWMVKCFWEFFCPIQHMIK